MEWASGKVIEVTAWVFHSPVLFSLLFSVSLAAVFITHDREERMRRFRRKRERTLI